MDDQTRSSKIRDAVSAVEKEAKGETSYEIRVKSLFESNKYYLFVTETF